MNQTLKEWVKQRYPRHVASLKRQQATHERAVERKAAVAAQPKALTKKRAKALNVISQRAAERKARREKHARKTI